MKKIIFALAIVMTLGFAANAQRGTDGFFGYNDGLNDNRDPLVMPGMPTSPIGTPGNDSAPLGSGLMVLTALGAGYAIYRKKRS